MYLRNVLEYESRTSNERGPDKLARAVVSEKKSVMEEYHAANVLSTTQFARLLRPERV